MDAQTHSRAADAFGDSHLIPGTAGVVQHVYEAALGDLPWALALKGLADHVDADGAALAWQSDDEGPRVLESSGWLPGSRPQAPIDPGGLVLPIPEGRGLLLSVWRCRPRGGLSDREAETLSALLAHLGLALRVAMRIGTLAAPGRADSMTWMDRTPHATLPDTNVLGLQHTFGLTRAEARLVRRVVAGATLRDAATDLRVSVHTARTHLKRAMAKMGVCRQGDMIRLVLTGSTGAPSPHA